MPFAVMPSPAGAAALRERFLRSVAATSPFYLLFNHLPDVSFFAKDAKCRIVAANRHFYERFGFTEESDIIGKDDFELFPSRLAESFRKDDLEVLRTGQPRLNITELFFNRQGIPDWFITNKLPVFDRRDRAIGVMGTTHSYAGRKQVLQPYLQSDHAVEYIRSHFRERISVEDLAAMAHLSTRQLQRKFVETFGASPQSFIMKLRIQAACEALQRAGSQISEVARQTGFCDQSTFTLHFRKHIGMTPLRYQRQFRLVLGAGV
ncbi:MAG: helix-turn-helix domain-containing protein [Roseimicrobium sp.]